MVSQVKLINYIPDFQKNPAKRFVLSNDAFSSPIAGQLRYNSTSNVPSWFNGTVEKSLYDIKLNEFANPDGNVSLNSQKITNLQAGTNPNDAVTYSQLQLSQAGLDPKASCTVATTGALSGATYNATGGTNSTGSFSSAPTTIDGVTLANGNRVLVKDQSDLKQNGIYSVVSSGNWERATDQDGTPSSEVSAGNYSFIEQGTVNQGKSFVIKGYSALPSDGTITLNDSSLGNIEWVYYNQAPTYTASNGVQLVTNDFQANVSQGLQIVSNAITLKLNSNGGLVKNLGTGTDELGVNVDDSTIEINTNTVRIKDLGVTTAKLNDNAVTPAKINSSVAGNGLTGGGGTALSVGAGTGITVNSDDVAINTSLVPRYYSFTITGDGSTTQFTLTHNANTSRYYAFVINNTTNDHEEIAYGRNTSDPNNKTDILFSPAPTNGLVYTAVVVVF